MSMTLDQISSEASAEQAPSRPSVFGNARIKANAYDEVPYRSYPYVQSHPARLATIATLLGLRPTPVTTARVLELGCCTGGNIIPMAEQLPEATFTGVDFSARQISDGCGAIQETGLTNVKLLHKDILEIDTEFGEFDYIIAHGVYSWVPPQVQAKILQICKQNLSSNGVAYLSYNTYPGWRMRGIIRDIMLYRARNLGHPSERLNRSRELINFLAESVQEENNPYGVLLRKELELLNCKNEQYLLHDHLEVHNEPVYFSEFASRASAVGLQYLGEAEFGAMCSRNLPQNVQAVLSAISSDVIETEQYMDFLRNRTFRQTLLVHAGQRIDRQVQAQRLLKMFVASPLKPESPIEDVNSNDTVKFCGKSAVTKTRDPLMKATLLQLSELYPTSVEISQVIGTTLTELRGEPAFVDPTVLTSDSNRVAEPLIRCFETGQVELSVIPTRFVTTVSERPSVSAYTRFQARTSNIVTSLRHTTVELSDLQRHVAQHLDGTRMIDQLNDLLVELAQQQKIVVHHQGKPVKDHSKIRELIDKPVDVALRQLAKFVLLTA